jgi:hypothetical protein
MAANFIEVQEEQSTDFVDPTKQEEQDPNLTAAPATADTAPEPVKDEVPEKYKGKSLDEIVRMHQEAEKLIGRQAQEVGEVRKLADSLLKQQLESKHDTQQPVTAQEIDWFEDPQKAVNQALENNPLLKQLAEQQALQAQQATLQKVEKAHPDYLSIAQSDDFINWVKESKIRMGMMAQAENYDADAALELLGTYKSVKGIKAQQQQTSQAADESLKKADEASRSKALKTAAVQQGGTGESTKPIYRRADLIRLRMQDPKRYEDMADDILAAYNEGRVR